MRRLVPLLAVLVAGCATAGSSPPNTLLATGALRQFASYGGNPEPGEYRGGQCSIYSEWVKIENADGQLWVPRTSLSWIEITPK